MSAKTYKQAEDSYVWLGVDPKPKDMHKHEVKLGQLRRVEWRGAALTAIVVGLSDDGTRWGKERPYRVDLLRPASYEEMTEEVKRRRNANLERNRA